MKILLVGINAKYIHSNLAIYSLKSYGEKVAARSIEIAEYTINQQTDYILKDIYERKPELIGFSCYLWNISLICELLPEIKKILPQAVIWLGGPEVSFESRQWLMTLPDVKGIMVGEGEKTFAELICQYTLGQNKDAETEADIAGLEAVSATKDMLKLADIPGLVYREGEEIFETVPREPMDMDEIPFPYEDISLFKNRIIYYETSRGCPFGCAYCLSSVDKKLRFRSLEKVFRELSIFIEAMVPQVKFVDRTFNCDRRHSMAILEFIKERDNGITNFHFEVAGDLLTKEEIQFISSLRPGLIQLEIGVQSTNEETLKAICRHGNLKKLKENVALLRQKKNLHLHLDLIAGLPKEDFASFRNSFNEVYAMGGNELQLGFLKLLKGAPMTQMAKEYGIVSRNTPPYEVLYTKDISFAELLGLKEVEEMLEIYHNSGQFTNSERFLLSMEENPFSYYENLAYFYKKKKYPVIMSARQRRYEILLEYLEEKLWNVEEKEKQETLSNLKNYLTLDYYLRENAKCRPEFAPNLLEYKNVIREFYEKEENRQSYFPDYEGYDAKQIARMTHAEVLDDKIFFFDYKHRDPVTGNAKLQVGEIT